MAWILFSALGCGGHEPNAVLDAADLLERYDKVRQQHDPAHFSESELGEFTVTKRWSANEDSDTKDGSRRYDNARFVIHFRLCAVVADEEMTEFTEMLTTHGERLRSLIHETVQKEKIDKLNSPDLGILKSELTKCINQCLGRPIVRNVVFPDFAFEQG
jgi:hypothetical protein